MVRKTISPVLGHIRIIFELPASLWADRVFVVGDFNQGRPGSTPLCQTEDGVWRATLDLPVGRQYQFHYLVNGVCTTDFHADGFAFAAGGVPNSLMCIKVRNVSPIRTFSHGVAAENRPAFQGWLAACVSCALAIAPRVKTLGYAQSSLRDYENPLP